LRVWGISATLGNLKQAAEVLGGSSVAEMILVDSTIKRAMQIRTLIPKSVEAFPWGGHLGLAMAKRVARLKSSGRIVFDYDMAIAEPLKAPGGEAGVDLWPLFEAVRGVPTLYFRGELSDILAPATLTEMVLRHNTGATIQLDSVGMALLSETPGRVVVAIDPAQTAALTQEAATQKIALTKIGVTGGDSLDINDAKISLVELRKAHTETFKKLFG
jgi:hypothetical protein